MILKMELISLIFCNSINAAKNTDKKGLTDSTIIKFWTDPSVRIKRDN